jgi:RimJ/RimL family protein N-acetyltransferase
MVCKNRERLKDFFAGTVLRTQTKTDTKAFLEWMQEARGQKQYYPFVIVTKNTGDFLGFVDLKNLDWHLPKGEIGFYTDQAAEGKGLMSLVLPQFCDYCFTEIGLHKVFLRTHGSNIAPQRIALKSGFTHEGVLRQDYKTSAGDYIDLLYYGTLAMETANSLRFEKVENRHPDFQRMVCQLDLELAERDGDAHGFYHQYNSTQNLKHCLLAYQGNQAVACGAFKAFDTKTIEIKRMYTLMEFRGKGFAGKLLQQLESWAATLGYSHAVLETGKRQPEAIARYTKSGYATIPNYGPYKSVSNSICFKKAIIPFQH